MANQRRADKVRVGVWLAEKERAKLRELHPMEDDMRKFCNKLKAISEMVSMYVACCRLEAEYEACMEEHGEDEVMRLYPRTAARVARENERRYAASHGGAL